jgi:hypothetical protein
MQLMKHRAQLGTHAWNQSLGSLCTGEEVVECEHIPDSTVFKDVGLSLRRGVLRELLKEFIYRGPL